MNKKNVFATALLIVVLLAGFFGYNYFASRQNKHKGQEKFSKALSELRTENPSVDNPCLGTSVLRSHSYAELSSKTIEEIKDLAKKDPGSC